MAKMRIQKALGDAGILSRRKAEELIKAGKITVNGHRAEPGNPIDTVRDVIVIDGKKVEFPRRKENLYIMLNKPRGYVTTTSDELGRRCVTELLDGITDRVYPVGRLDKNTEGLLLLTNDGQFANMMMHPRNHVSKTYRLTVRPDINDDQLVKLSTGVQIDEDLITMPASVIVMEKAPGRVVLQITISEGKNRQIRRMCEAVGLEVARLRRISIGPIKLGMLQPGQWRELKKSEVLALRNAGTISDEIVNAPGEGRDSHNSRGGRGHGSVNLPTGSFGKPEKEKGSYGKNQPAKRGGKPTAKYGDKPTAKYGDKPATRYGDKPTAKYGDKPAAKYGGKPAARYGDKPAAKYGDKPAAKYGDKPAPKKYGSKPASKSWNKAGGGKPSSYTKKSNTGRR